MTISLLVAILAFACFLAAAILSRGSDLKAVGLALLTLWLAFLR